MIQSIHDASDAIGGVKPSEMGQVAIEVRNLTKKYRDASAAVDRVSFTVKKGEILGFLGPNGAGKTTTMRMITGYLSPTSGAVYVNGRNVFDNPLWVKRQIGYLPETPPLYTDMTVHAFLEHVAHLKSLPHRYIPTEIASVVSRCGLGSVESRLIQHLSKGFRQRVGLAQALLGSPAVLILDEPTVGLDPAQIREVRSLIKDLAKDHTVILSTHILPEVQMICDRVIIIHNGKLVAGDTIENLNRSNADEARTRIVLSQSNADALRFLKSYPGVKKVRQIEEGRIFELRLEAEDPSLLAHLLGKGLKISECYNVAPTLEEIFLRIVSGRGLQEEEEEESSASQPQKKEAPSETPVEAKESSPSLQKEPTQETPTPQGESNEPPQGKALESSKEKESSTKEQEDAVSASSETPEEVTKKPTGKRKVAKSAASKTAEPSTQKTAKRRK